MTLDGSSEALNDIYIEIPKAATAKDKIIALSFIIESKLGRPHWPSSWSTICLALEARFPYLLTPGCSYIVEAISYLSLEPFRMNHFSLENSFVAYIISREAFFTDYLEAILL